MKTKLLLLFVALSIGAYAQGDLQFNQVLTYTLNGTQANVYTVPAGKVAKIAKAIEKTDTGQYYSVFTINGAYHYPNDNFPQKEGMWLKAGDIIGSTTGIYGNSYNITISIIEYNIISE
tara:strand:- start:59 stop:415 length:357 start_codon:yes stop_codon:yes gene_type:complete